MSDYRATKRPVHVGVRPTQCAVCHTQDAWSPSALNHPWPLTGAHAKATCEDCHASRKDKPPVYEGTSKLCVDCHRDDYDGAAYPGHSEFATTCADCHTTTAFRPARKPKGAVDDTRAQEPALEKHAGKAKKSGGAAPTHTVAREQPAAVDAPNDNAALQTAAPVTPEPAAPPTPRATERPHPEGRFPIKTGSHADIECRTCHNQGGAMSKANTDCVQCHARTRFDRKHRNVDNYPAGAAPANFCVQCHTDGTVGSAR